MQATNSPFLSTPKPYHSMPAPNCYTRNALATFVLVASLGAYAADYDSLIMQARDGTTAPVLQYFAEQAKANRLTPAQINDWLLVSGWAGDDKQTVATYLAYRQQVPLQASSLAAVGRAYRNLQHWDLAASLIALAIERQPDQSDWYLTHAATLADGGQYALAREVLANFEARFAEQRLAGLLTRAYVERAAKEPYEALRHAQQAIELAPDNRQAQTIYLLSLRDADMPEQALNTIASKQWSWVTPGLLRALEADYAAELVRIARTATSTEAERLDIAKRALLYYEHMLARWRLAPPDAQLPQDIRRARLDRLVALWLVKDAPTVLSEYAELRTENPAIPDYALMAVGAASLQQRLPEQALEIYTGVVERSKISDPDMYENAQVGVFYSLVETEQLDKARDYAEQYLAQEPMLRYIPGNPDPVPNSRWSEAQRERASANFFADRLALAQSEQKGMLALGPGDAHIRLGLASTLRNRGLPRQAAQELKIIEANEDPSAPALMLEQAGVAQQLRDWKTAEALVHNVIARYPEDPSAQRVMREWQLSQKAEVRMAAEYSDSNSNTALGEGAMHYSLVGYSAPLNYNWRLFAGLDRRSGRYLEGYGQSNQVRAGAQWVDRDTAAEFEISTLRSSGRSYTGLRVQANQDLNDHWQLSADAARNSANTPLRALRAGVTANEFNLGMRWQAHESTSVSLSTGWMDFSDNNRRWAVSATSHQRLLTQAKVQLDANLELYTSRNSAPGGPYFAPARDWSVLPGLTARHLIWRSYERTWRQELNVSAGVYSQKDYGQGRYQQVRYGQQLRWSDTTELGFQTGLTWRPYDGLRERAVFFGFNLSHLF
ncbi:poly-beta-1,6 N-acetyl-D-glucosamine export porin PgaA [Lampropedia aestuarii]|uniref:Poly-beta-1,6 N-acetyl-D-glucosamine export porin PgaA n=1 Tax=Lampropedia aestuarii TaxID=2562762 RepID=A0A4S5BIZ9_9BURK|nr:poly-beta-1,6 N-acetyl-D-glucosamine export porin PgaA [Lampropedia aestuarii]